MPKWPNNSFKSNITVISKPQLFKTDDENILGHGSKLNRGSPKIIRITKPLS